MDTGDKVAAVGTAAAMYGLGVGSLLGDPHGRATDLPQMTQARQGEPLVPYKSFPQPAQPAPRGGVAVLGTIDLLKAPILPKAVRAALGGDVSEKK